MRSRATGRSVGCPWAVIPFILNWNRAAKVVAAALVLFLISAPLFSQGNAGRILGVVTDQQGAAVPGVTVTITDTQRGVSRTLKTDDAGEFNAPNLLPGTYSVRAEAQGFKPTERTGVTLEVSQDLRVDIQLQIGDGN